MYLDREKNQRLRKGVRHDFSLSAAIPSFIGRHVEVDTMAKASRKIRVIMPYVANDSSEIDCDQTSPMLLPSLLTWLENQLRAQLHVSAITIRLDTMWRM